MQIPLLGKTIKPITGRSLKFVEEDKSAARAMAQAAINVELFTIPLYMSTMYSIHGMHQINSDSTTYYKGREWPGMSTRAMPGTPNAKAFNIIFSVFIQEMLHLQMASNIATALDVKPSFTSLSLQTKEHGWHCYGPDCSVIPHIVDLKNTSNYSQVRVNLEALNENQCKLFLAIEQPEKDARKELEGDPENAKRYFPEVPFAGWQVDYTERNLPMFGTIGWMYECYAQYLSIEYADGESLFTKMFRAGSVQQDMFNSKADGHPKKEFPRFDTLLTTEDQASAATAFDKVIDMMSAISDQGEGNTIEIQRYRKQRLLTAVDGKYQEDRAALEADYPSYDQDGKQSPSRDAAARADSKKQDHFERFLEVREILKQVVTWETWHAAWDKEGKGWSAADLTNAQYDPETAPHNIPTPQQVADALNRLKAQGSATRKMLSEVAVGAIAGITTVLDTYWQDQGASFPYPSMVGSGDRMSICWAITGQSADLRHGLDAPGKDTLYHACQGLSLSKPDTGASCAAIEIYHTCRGSNGCHAQGGCGFAQRDTGGGGLCGAKVAQAPAAGSTGKVTPYSAPSDNKCASFGGCAVPISASQLYPETAPPPAMKLYDFEGPDHQAVPLGQTMAFTKGDSVYEKAWEAYKAVMAKRGAPVTAPMPEPTDLRVALPPST
ncbi:ferritin-like domain-containing protein [Pseudoduganella sp. R-32]|uniref:ferritin-like domain-containing protein n=1 Tax=Pseudoduganella sp. R-32 TaxID=3404061 RepID=UPI003CF0FB5A